MTARWLAIALCVAPLASSCAAVDGDRYGTSGSATAGSGGGTLDPGDGGSAASVAPPTKLSCSDVPQEILVLDFRSGWWSGGGGGTFHTVALQTVVETCDNIEVEYHHFEIEYRIKCKYASAAGGSCQEFFEPTPATSDQIIALFDQPKWDDYTQVWILSGSEMDATDVTLTGELMEHFLAETQGSCIPVLIGAGDGFITHGNAVASGLGLGNLLTTELAQPGFFSVAQETAPVAIYTRMHAGSELLDHLLFQDVDSIADSVSTSFQTAHGDSVQNYGPTYEVIARDAGGRPAVAIGAMQLAADEERPFIIDSGFQRYYAVGQDEGTRTLLENIVKYLGLVGCKSEPPK